MRMMGAESVGYHEHSVLERGDDRVGNALAYYASRGETPIAWGGAGAAWLGLDGEVGVEEWRSVSAPGALAIPTAASGWCTVFAQGWSWWCRRTSRWPSWASSAGPRICT